MNLKIKINRLMWFKKNKNGIGSYSEVSVRDKIWFFFYRILLGEIIL